jgi:hypothetical protein
MTQEKEEDSFIDNLFDDGEPDVVEAAPDPEPEVKAEEPAPEEPSQVEAEEPKQSEPTADEKKEDETQESWTKAAALDERRKRQDAEKRIEALEQKIASYEETLKNVEPEKVPDPIDDPDGFTQHQDRKMFNIALKFDQRQMQKEHDDYEDVVTHFKAMAKANPALADNFAKQEFPATYAYNTAKAELDAKKYQDPDFLKNLENDLKAKILAELKGETTASKPDASTLPKLQSATSVVSNVEQVIQEDEKDLEGLFSDLKY